MTDDVQHAIIQSERMLLCNAEWVSLNRSVIRSFLLEINVAWYSSTDTNVISSVVSETTSRNSVYKNKGSLVMIF